MLFGATLVAEYTSTISMISAIMKCLTYYLQTTTKKRREKKQSQRLYLERFFCQCKIQFKGMFNISKNKNGPQKDIYICILRNTDVYFASKYYLNQIVIFFKRFHGNNFLNVLKNV